MFLQTLYDAHISEPQSLSPPRLFTAMKVWECHRRSHKPVPTFLSQVYFTPFPLFKPKTGFPNCTEKQLMKKIREVVQEPDRPSRTGTSYVQKRNSGTTTPMPKLLVTNKRGRLKACLPLTLHPGKSFKLKKFLPLFSERHSVSTTPNGSREKCYVRGRKKGKDQGTTCSTMQDAEVVTGWNEDGEGLKTTMGEK